jgi:hypothetical protein
MYVCVHVLNARSTDIRLRALTLRSVRMGVERSAHVYVVTEAHTHTCNY